MRTQIKLAHQQQAEDDDPFGLDDYEVDDNDEDDLKEEYKADTQPIEAAEKANIEAGNDENAEFFSRLDSVWAMIILQK